jgi:hypothetical protein
MELTNRKCFDLWCNKKRKLDRGEALPDIPSTEPEVKKLIRQCLVMIGKVKVKLLLFSNLL